MRNDTVPTEVIREAVRLACRAPSLHNTQPWLWQVDGRTVELFLDKDRVLHGTDHLGRAALLACGAVLDHFRVAMAGAGCTARVERLPDCDNPLLLARFDVTAAECVTDDQRRRADAIRRRRTDRLPFDAPPDWDHLEARMERIVTADVVRVDTVPDEYRVELAEASQLTELLRQYDSSYHAELRWWTEAFNTTQGIPRSALVSGGEGDRVGRRFPVGSPSDERASLGQDHSKVLVLSTHDNRRSSVLQCGEMLSAVLLEATMAGLATCTLTHITELRASRRIVAALIDQTTTPQVLVRVGVAPKIENPPPPTPRRPMDEVLHVRAECR